MRCGCSNGHDNGVESVVKVASSLSFGRPHVL
jgi:hypothetical protein